MDFLASDSSMLLVSCLEHFAANLEVSLLTTFAKIDHVVLHYTATQIFQDGTDFSPVYENDAVKCSWCIYFI